MTTTVNLPTVTITVQKFRAMQRVIITEHNKPVDDFAWNKNIVIRPCKKPCYKYELPTT